MSKLRVFALGISLFLLNSSFLTYAQKIPFSKANWIRVGYNEGIGQRACPVFKKQFKLARKVKSGTLYITALGLYEASLNGKRVGDAYFTPGFTNYTSHLQYQKYDISEYLKSNNMLKVTVGEGWYRGVFRGLTGDSGKNNYGVDAGLILELNIEYVDGTKVVINSDSTWQCSSGGIEFSELYNGEMYNNGVQIFNWSPVKLLNPPSAILDSTLSEPVRKQEVFKPQRIITTPKKELVVDFGQNFAGWIRLNIAGKKGDTVRIYHAEVLDKEGNFYTGNLREAKAVDTYVLNGKGIEILEPHFTYHGFRYVKIEGFKPTFSNIKAVALYSDLKKTGTFSCSDRMLNKLQKNIEWSLNSNFFDIPTDCPQRSERLGWTADGQVFANTASFLRDTKRFYSKWLKDVASEQGKNGGIPNYVPTLEPYREEVKSVAGWGDAACIVPMTLFEKYGDTLILRENYTLMKSWVNYINKTSIDGFWQSGGFGDWLAPGPKTDVSLINQCFWAYSTSLLVKAAKILGEKADVETYTYIEHKIKEMFVSKYLVPSGKLSSNTQTAYVLALEFNMVREQLRATMAAQLVALIEKNNNHLATGFLGTPYLLKVLSDHGYSDVAYTLLNQKTYPSWLYPITLGATTIWERWDGMEADGSVKPTSYNHSAYGAVGSWLYEYVSGIRCAAPGYKKIIIKPEIGGNLTWAKGSYDCIYGKIISEWKLSGNKVTMNVTIPLGTTAEVWVPGKKMITVGAGKYVFTGQLISKQTTITN